MLYYSFKCVPFYYSTRDLQVFEASSIEARKNECASESRTTKRSRKTLICIFLVTQVRHWLPVRPKIFFLFLIFVVVYSKSRRIV